MTAEKLSVSFHRLTEAEIRQHYKDDLIGTTGYLYYIRKITCPPGKPFVIPNVLEFCRDWEIAKSAFYRAVDKLKQKGYMTWETTHGLIFTDLDNKVVNFPPSDKKCPTSGTVSHERDSDSHERDSDSHERDSADIYRSHARSDSSELSNTADTPPISPAKGEGEVKMLMGIRSSQLSFATFEATMEHIAGAIASLEGKSSAAAPQTKLNPTALQTDEGVFADAKTLRRLSKITGLSVESLRTNVGLQKAFERHPQNVESALDYLEAESKTFKPGIGFVVVAIREGRSLANAGGAVFGEWIREGEALGLVAWSMTEGDDILIAFRPRKTKFDEPQLYSKLKGMSWDDIKC
jgi:hypothetical protein